MVPMRDGARLATDVYRPADGREGPPRRLPVLLLRTPYDKTAVAALTGWPRRFAGHGYAVVVQDCRGCFKSQGEFDFLWPEAYDGQDTVAWIRQQEWCNGRVGTWGASWESWAQTALAAAGTEGIKAMVPVMSGANAHASSVRHGGAMELRMIAWAFLHSAYNTQEALKLDPRTDVALNVGATPFSGWLRRWPIRPGETQLAFVPSYERWVFELLTTGDYGDRWLHPSVNPLAHMSRFTDAPTMLIGGWYDAYTRGTLELFEALCASKHGPIKVMVGPWVHGQPAMEQPYAGDVWFGHAATIDSASLHLRWYDRWLRHVANGAERDAPVRLFVMGGGLGTRRADGRLDHGGRWRDENEWPLARTQYTPYYLHEDGRLQCNAPTVRDCSTTFDFDPSHPVPTIGGNLSSLVDLTPLLAWPASPSDPGLAGRLAEFAPGGGFDQRAAPGMLGAESSYLPLAARADVLVFQTAPLETDVEVTGPIKVHLWVASSAVDTDVTAKLVDVYPASASYRDGYALNLTDSILRLRYRDGPTAPKWLTAGKPVSCTIVLYPTSNLFAAGHRIRLDVSSSNFPRFDVNSNTGEPLGRARHIAIAQNTIFHDAARPSHIMLPVIGSASTKR